MVIMRCERVERDFVVATPYVNDHNIEFRIPREWLPDGIREGDFIFKTEEGYQIDRDILLSDLDSEKPK